MKTPSSLLNLLRLALLWPLALALNAFAADAVHVMEPYVRLMPPGAPATAAYMMLHNMGAAPLKLVKVETRAAKSAELHTHVSEQGVMKMRPIPAIDIPANGAATLAPGGLHIMLINPAPLKEGERVTLKLYFSDGRTQEVTAPVKSPLGAAGHQH